MTIKTVRICEEADARQLLKDGALDAFLQMWHERYPKENPAKLQQIKLIKNMTGCSLREAKQMVDEWCLEVRFEIGDRFYVRFAVDRPLLYRKAESEWILATNNMTHTASESLALGMGWPQARSGRFKNYGEF